jgi:hypothetical protein
MKLLQEKEVETNASRRREDEIINVQRTRERAFNNAQLRQDKIKEARDRRTKGDEFQLGDWVMRWDAMNKDKGKHGKFDHPWLGPFKIRAYRGRNAYLLEESDGKLIGGGPVNGMFLKHYVI